VLGFDEYIESHADGLQILRYNLTKAYIPHLDWIDGNDQLAHDYESGLKGGNRYVININQLPMAGRSHKFTV
jgi:hypothetical protein